MLFSTSAHSIEILEQKKKNVGKECNGKRKRLENIFNLLLRTIVHRVNIQRNVLDYNCTCPELGNIIVTHREQNERSFLIRFA